MSTKLRIDIVKFKLGWGQINHFVKKEYDSIQQMHNASSWVLLGFSETEDEVLTIGTGVIHRQPVSFSLSLACRRDYNVMATCVCASSYAFMIITWALGLELLSRFKVVTIVH